MYIHAMPWAALEYRISDKVIGAGVDNVEIILHCITLPIDKQLSFRKTSVSAV